jgi:hypothetical protein
MERNITLKKVDAAFQYDRRLKSKSVFTFDFILKIQPLYLHLAVVFLFHLKQLPPVEFEDCLSI